MVIEDAVRCLRCRWWAPLRALAEASLLKGPKPTLRSLWVSAFLWKVEVVGHPADGVILDLRQYSVIWSRLLYESCSVGDLLCRP